MKLLIRLSILALAAVGAHSLFERLRPRVSDAIGSGTAVSDTLPPAVREAASTVRDASAHAAHDVADASRQAAGDLVTELEDAVTASHPTGSNGPIGPTT